MRSANKPFINFGGSESPPVSYKEADIVILPFCYEHAPSYGKGSGEGPYHILAASEQLEGLDEETQIAWGSFKIFTEQPLIPDSNPERAVQEMKQAAKRVLADRKFLLCLGGDHAISIGPVCAASELYPGIGVLQVDAHLDLRNDWHGSRWNHACVMRRIAEDAGTPIVQVGIRCISQEEADFIRLHPSIRQIYSHRIDPFDNSWIDQVVSLLPETVYITIDLDGLDPSVIPGTGTPVPDGLTYRQLTGLIKAVGTTKTVVAGDINELVKIEGMQVSEFTAAKIASKIFVYCVSKTS